jgi:hypothetical protein
MNEEVDAFNVEVCNQDYKIEISSLKPGMFSQTYAVDMHIGSKSAL